MKKNGLILIVFLLNSFNLQAQVQVTEQRILMGSVFEFTVVAQDSLQAQSFIQTGAEEVERIENLISEWRDFTPISQVNAAAGINAVTVNQEVFQLTERAQNYSKMSAGSFDISVIPLLDLWKFDRGVYDMPDQTLIDQRLENVGYQNLNLNKTDSTIFLAKEGMKIGFGSIGKGYAADACRKKLQKLGVKAGLVNASGDISAWGRTLEGLPWNIGVQHPEETENPLTFIQIEEASVTTSGNYEKYALIDGEKYGHIINPLTGIPSRELISVTIVGPYAEFANFLSTTIMVLGEENGLKLIRKFPEYTYLIVKNDGQFIQNICLE